MANSFKNKKVDLTTTDNTTLYTTPTANVALVKSILVSNDAGSGCNLDVTLTDSHLMYLVYLKLRLYLLIQQPNF